MSDNKQKQKNQLPINLSNLGAIIENLGTKNPKRPNIRLRRKSVRRQRLGGCPAQWYKSTLR
jgi:hypothetical protein